MVLLTPSAVSAAISGGVICLFTFLLFLSGYVLQQQTVKSLQEALRRPPEPKPVPTLPARFRDQDNETKVVLTEAVGQINIGGSNTAEDSEVKISAVLVEVQETANSPPKTQDYAQASDTVQDPSVEATPFAAIEAAKSQSSDTLAYILSLPNPSDLCSAVLFAKWQRLFSNLHSKPTIMILYPITWETSQTPLHIAALTLMRDMQDELSMTYHPVQINSAWSGVGINAHLLGELQRIRWDFDRALYLKSPGLAVDIHSLDRALSASSVKTAWSQLSASAGQDPEMMLYTRQKGLMMARNDMRKLTATAFTSHANHHANEMDVEAAAQKAAYVLFDEADLEHRRSEKEWYGGVFERFERERRDICKGRALLPGDEDKLDLRRKTR